jgi:hypothetical protein
MVADVCADRTHQGATATMNQMQSAMSSSALSDVRIAVYERGLLGIAKGQKSLLAANLPTFAPGLTRPIRRGLSPASADLR